MIIVAMFTVIPIGILFFKYSKYPWISFLLYASFGSYYLIAFAAMRQGIALGLTTFAFHFAVRKKFFPFWVMVILGFCFHMSALFFLPVYWIAKCKLYKNSFIIAIVTIIVGQLLGVTMFHFFNSYSRIEFEEANAGGEMMYLFYILVLFLGYVYRKILQKIEYGNVYWYMMAIVVFLWPMCSANPALFRLTFYFQIYLGLYVSNFVTQLIPKYVSNILIFFFIIITFFSIDYFVVKKEAMALYPYYFYWETNANLTY
jgi:hypothetical protein